MATVLTRSICAQLSVTLCPWFSLMAPLICQILGVAGTLPGVVGERGASELPHATTIAVTPRRPRPDLNRRSSQPLLLTLMPPSDATCLPTFEDPPGPHKSMHSNRFQAMAVASPRPRNGACRVTSARSAPDTVSRWSIDFAVASNRRCDPRTVLVETLHIYPEPCRALGFERAVSSRLHRRVADALARARRDARFASGVQDHPPND